LRCCKREMKIKMMKGQFTLRIYRELQLKDNPP